MFQTIMTYKYKNYQMLIVSYEAVSDSYICMSNLCLKNPYTPRLLYYPVTCFINQDPLLLIQY